MFHDMIVDVTSNKRLHLVVTELFIKGKKRNISLVLIAQSFFWVPKVVKPNTTHFLTMKIPNKQEFQQITNNLI